MTIYLRESTIGTWAFLMDDKNTLVILQIVDSKIQLSVFVCRIKLEN